MMEHRIGRVYTMFALGNVRSLKSELKYLFPDFVFCIVVSIALPLSLLVDPFDRLFFERDPAVSTVLSR